jgi:predicted phosphodiesterase
MRVGGISDIHGNVMALEAVLTALKQDRVDRIVCLGDVAAMGPHL